MQVDSESTYDSHVQEFTVLYCTISWRGAMITGHWTPKSQVENLLLDVPGTGHQC